MNYPPVFITVPVEKLGFELAEVYRVLGHNPIVTKGLRDLTDKHIVSRGIQDTLQSAFHLDQTLVNYFLEPSNPLRDYIRPSSSTSMMSLGDTSDLISEALPIGQ